GAVPARGAVARGGLRGRTTCPAPLRPRVQRKRRDKGLTLPQGQGPSIYGMNALTKPVTRTAVAANGLPTASASRCAGPPRRRARPAAERGRSWHLNESRRG